MKFRRGSRTDDPVAAVPVPFSLRTVSLAFASGETIEAVCEHIIEHACPQLTADAGAIFFPDDETGAYAAAAVSLPPETLHRLEGPVGSAMRSAAPIGLIDRGQPSGVPSQVDPGDPFEILCVPVALDDQVLGAFVFVRGPGSDRFDEDAVGLATSIVSELAPSIERVRMQSSFGHERTRSHLTQRQLEVYAEDFRETFVSERDRNIELSSALSELETAYLATIRAVSTGVEARDPHTSGHVDRVTRYALTTLELVDPGLAKDPAVSYGFVLHDVGNLAVPEAILLKAGPLTEADWKVVRRHPEVGARMLEGIGWLARAVEIVACHHERWDGRGYPHGLVKDEIPTAARVFAVADAYDAMRSGRPHRKPMSVDAAQMGLRTNSGTQFWSTAVEAFLSVPVAEMETVDPL